MKRHSKQWFIDRIGKRIYREPIDSCKCVHCQKHNSFIIDDGMKDGKRELRREFHASYLFDCQNDLQIDYFDKPLEG